MANNWKDVYPEIANDATANKWLAFRTAGCGARIVGAFFTQEDAEQALGDNDGGVQQFGEMLCDCIGGNYMRGPHNTPDEIEEYFLHLEDEGELL